jgi:transcriptional activator of cad operon
MDSLTTIPLRIGAWRVDPRTGQLSRDAEMVRVEARTLRLLLYLAQRAGEVVSLEELLDQVWSGVVVTQDSVYQAVASLRRILGDDPKQPTYIATVPRLGYRMVASVSPWVDEPAVLELPTADASRLVDVPQPAAVTRRRLTLAVIAVLAVVGIGIAVTHQSTLVQPPPRSVAVLPFLDLTTEAMNEEYFADGMTEELIGKLARIPNLSVPPPTSSFYFKGKQLTVADIAHSLGVAYVLDGSVRKSGTTLRISARLVRAADGYVVWSETYDRPENDKLRVQEDIAGEVAQALPAAIR